MALLWSALISLLVGLSIYYLSLDRLTSPNLLSAKKTIRQLEKFVSSNVHYSFGRSLGGRVKMCGTATRLLQKIPLGDGLLGHFYEAQIQMETELFSKLLFLLIFASFLIGLLLFESVTSAVAICIGAVASIQMLISRIGFKRRKKLQAQLPEALALISTALSSGGSLVQALDHAIREGEPPMSDELKKAVDEVSVGVGLEEALDRINERLSLEEIESIVAAVTIHRRAGGNLAQLLTGAAEFLKERARLKDDLMTITAQARFSGKVVGVMPLIVMGLILAIDPEYLSPIFSTISGIFLITLAAFANIAGFFIINRLLKVDI